MSKRKIIKIDEEKCNGCGLCMPNCPEGAIQIIDNKARLVSDLFCDGLGACIGYCPQGAITIEERDAQEYDEKEVIVQSPCVCPGATQLSHWPVQLMLVPAFAPYLDGADLLIAADCVPFAYPDFHRELLKGKTLIVGCPKLDDLELYREKLGQIFRSNEIKSITYAHMEVPCCFGLLPIIQEAIAQSGKKIPFQDVTITIRGEKANVG